jgi:hypothetical protein
MLRTSENAVKAKFVPREDVHDTYQARILSVPLAMDAGEGKSLILQRHFALPS